MTYDAWRTWYPEPVEEDGVEWDPLEDFGRSDEAYERSLES